MLVVLIVVLMVAAAAAESSWVRMEPSVEKFSSTNWIRESKYDLEKVSVVATFVLKHDAQKIKAFEAQLLSKATPSSANYGQWLKLAAIKEQIAPSEEALKAVVDYVNSFGVEAAAGSVKVSPLGDKVHVRMSVKLANAMFNTDFGAFRSVVDRRVVLPRITKPYSLPSSLAASVQIVDDIMRFPAVRQPLMTVGADESADAAFSSCGTKCNGFTTPDVLQQAYSFGPVKTATKGNSMSVAEFQLQYYDQPDLDSFSSACGVDVDVAVTIGGNQPKICEAGGCVEALLDIEYIGAVAGPIPLTVLYLSSYSLLDWVDQVIALESPPLINSVSYGNDEIQQTSVEYMEACNTQFMVAGTMGLSILFASGDQGVWGRSGVGKTFNPDFPAASPYVTAVGGTDFSTKSVIGAESAWSCGGGGFSDTFPMPSWQESAVSGYLTKAAAAGVLPAASLFNATGRAYPDLSALGGQVNPYCVGIRGGSFGGVAGTSASCPVVAGIFAQLNNVRLAAGKPSLGWLNPLIYANPSCFNDVNDGSMNNCNAGTTGFSALGGWDPATGMGSPNFACLSSL